MRHKLFRAVAIVFVDNRPRRQPTQTPDKSATIGMSPCRIGAENQAVGELRNNETSATTEIGDR
ncbi:MAG: hypothetical protein AB4050_14195 [Synechococcus sp.]